MTTHENERSRTRAVYVISVAAELAGMHPQTLRIYERRGLVTPARTEGGNRRYSDADIAILKRISELTDEGMNLEGIRRVMHLEIENARLRAEVEQAREIARHAIAAAEGNRQRRRPRAAPPGGRRVRAAPVDLRRRLSRVQRITGPAGSTSTRKHPSEQSFRAGRSSRAIEVSAGPRGVRSPRDARVRSTWSPPASACRPVEAVRRVRRHRSPHRSPHTGARVRARRGEGSRDRDVPPARGDSRPEERPRAAVGSPPRRLPARRRRRTNRPRPRRHCSSAPAPCARRSRWPRPPRRLPPADNGCECSDRRPHRVAGG